MSPGYPAACQARTNERPMRPKPLIPMRVAMDCMSSVVGQDHSAGVGRRQHVWKRFSGGLLRRRIGLDVRRDETDELARQRDDLARVVAARAELSVDALCEDLDR